MKKVILATFILSSLAVSGCGAVEGSRSDCNIKGNISYNTGEKIYHLPEDQFYDVTEINEGKGEEWFCSEEEAVVAGFRRSER